MATAPVPDSGAAPPEPQAPEEPPQAPQEPPQASQEPPQAPQEPQEPPANTPTVYKEGETVLAYFANLLYEAEILQVKFASPGVVEKYKVHFQGWKSSWDSDIEPHQVIDHTDENLRLAHTLLKKVQSRSIDNSNNNNNNNNTAPPSGTTAGSGNENGSGVEKESGDNNNKKEEGDIKKKEGEEKGKEKPVEELFIVPAALKRQLVDDWEFITREHRLVSIPRNPNVRQILENWLNQKQESSRATAADLDHSKQVAEGLLEYFNISLPVFLLYQFERHQYDLSCGGFGSGRSRKVDRQKPGEVYGVEHFLRLVLKLPRMLTEAEMEYEVIQRIAEKVNELMKFIVKNPGITFLKVYPHADEKYLEWFERSQKS